ncbi:hypothetical protein NDR87_18920 [Nocardia sp. CDC159]|uniref:Uncharacterized protein n=1 Tax=Nocardia pulmonis TaxID=2951408 RepID=A0A9X2EDQ7_9NOCA|nr:MULTISPECIES: hypothetical protein [Nocardia]MCM6776236.1 hypothetical protein [Nocardia pulmonis]MCM6788438.1 hypothetical protein [Nocardia sp. CDC159]
MTQPEAYGPTEGLTFVRSESRRVERSQRVEIATGDLFLDQLRAIVEAAHDLPCESTVSVWVDGKWWTPDQIKFEHTVYERPGDTEEVQP